MRLPASAVLPFLAIVANAQDTARNLTIEFDDLAARARAAIETVNALEQQVNAKGHSLHPDLIAQRALVQSSMDYAEEALRAKDMDKLRERLTRARGHIDRLYKML